eukprot:CAMPEP_0117462678 /NCGR_PEP_ID=MMETSP0784-20121206/3180_1 /TAXON_ID=39447 /ORGANISM="" /LENGTH=780 /DNA_ID=CAMNT_0005256455 /DNA_START=85 /DNA_END=2426 /DNA_ORIENTATION=+
MKRRFQEIDAFADNDAPDRPRHRGTGFTDQELENRFATMCSGGRATSDDNGEGEALYDEATMRRMMRQQRVEEEAAAAAEAAARKEERRQGAAVSVPSQADVSTSMPSSFGDGQPDSTATPLARPQSLAPQSLAPQSFAPSSAEVETANAALSTGGFVVVRGLKAAAHLNGSRGRLGDLDHSAGRWEVTLISSGETKAIKPENLELDARDSSAPTFREDMTAEELFVPPPSPENVPAPKSPRHSDLPASAPAAAGGDSAGVAGLSSASLVGSVGQVPGSLRSTESSSSKSRRTTRRQGTVRWYNGRRKIGKVIPDDGKGGDFFIPAQGALNGSQVPPQPGGLFHGTRVSFMPAALSDTSPGNGDSEPSKKNGKVVCMDVRPLPGQVGLSCGVDTANGAKEKNDDRVAACDLHELGFFAGVFDGHRGCTCAEYVAKQLPPSVLQSYRARAKREGGMLKLSTLQETALISNAMVDAFEAVDKSFQVLARKKELRDGSTGIAALVSHGYEAAVPEAKPVQQEGGAASLWAKVAKKLGQEEPAAAPPDIAAPERPPGTVPAAPGGVAKLFIAWAGDSRAILCRGRQGLRCTEDHRPNRKDEMARIQRSGGFIGQDARGVWRVGPKEESRLAKELQKHRKKHSEEKLRWFLSTSRSFGDYELKVPDLIVIATPEVKVVDLVPEDWAVVLTSDGVTDVLSDQEVANVLWQAVAVNGKDPVAASKALVQTALSRGARDNLTVVVMRLGWASPPSANASLGATSAAGRPALSEAAAADKGKSDDDIFG